MENDKKRSNQKLFIITTANIMTGKVAFLFVNISELIYRGCL